MYIVVFVSCAGTKEAKIISRALIKNKIAACVNIISNLSSTFWWQGRIDTCKEALLVIKSKKKLLPQVIKLVKSLHSYAVPEIIALPIIAADKEYLKWLSTSVR